MRTFTRTGSQAWWALGQFWLAVNNYEGAILCAKTGLEELGDDVASPMAIDDTSMKLWVAEERIQKGHLSDGADMMLRILESRRNFTAERQKNNLLKMRDLVDKVKITPLIPIKPFLLSLS